MLLTRRQKNKAYSESMLEDRPTTTELYFKKYIQNT